MSEYASALIKIGEIENRLTSVEKNVHTCVSVNQIYEIKTTQAAIEKTVETVVDNYKELEKKVDVISMHIIDMKESYIKYTRSLWIVFVSFLLTIIATSYTYFTNIKDKIHSIDLKLTEIEIKIGNK